MLHQVGVGALGPVYRTYEPTRDRLVAVKAFRLDIVPEQAQALAEALSRATEAGLFHPSIVEPIAAGIEGSVAYRAEQYVAAESLDVAMRHYAPAPLDKVLPFITQLAGAIDFARASGIGHGALHPRDIFVTPDEASATGFGVVEALDAVGIRAPVRRPYTAPERIDGRPWSTPADIYSLAAIAFELLTGRRPAGTGAQIGALSEGPTSNAVHRVLARAMDESPERRYASALGFAGALEAASHDESAADVLPAPAATVVPTPPVLVEPPRGAPAPPASVVPIDPVEVALTEVDATLQHEPPPEPDAADLDLTPTFSDVHKTRRPATLFDDSLDAGEHELDSSREAPRFADALNLDDEVPGHSDDRFVEEQIAPAEERRPLEAEGESDSFDLPERSGQGMLPGAIMLIIGLLGGFGAGYVVFGRGRPAVATQAPVAAQQPSAATAQAPPPSQPAREFSDQQVTQRPPAAQPNASPGTPPRASPPPPGAAASGGRAATPVAPAVRFGRLVVRSTPPRAGVTLNGHWRGRTPLTLENLPLTRYIVRVIQPGFAVGREEVTLSPQDSSRTLSVTLERDQRSTAASSGRRGATPPPSPSQQTFSGTLYIDSRPQGANVLLDGKLVGKTPLRLPDVRIGTHVIRLELAEHRPFTTTARVAAGEEARVTGSLERFQ